MSVVVVGAGHGGVQVAASLREGGYEQPVVLVDAQDALPYQRPPLSKEFLVDPTQAAVPLRASSPRTMST